jgi:hypothetical protein
LTERPKVENQNPNRDDRCGYRVPIDAEHGWIDLHKYLGAMKI